MEQPIFVRLDARSGLNFIPEVASFNDGGLERLSFECLRWDCQLVWRTGLSMWKSLASLMSSLAWLLLGRCLRRRWLDLALATTYDDRDKGRHH
jgi:hypothetical protein